MVLGRPSMVRASFMEMCLTVSGFWIERRGRRRNNPPQIDNLPTKAAAASSEESVSSGGLPGAGGWGGGGGCGGRLARGGVKRGGESGDDGEIGRGLGRSMALEELLDESRVQVGGAELGVFEDLAKEGEVGPGGARRDRE